MQGTPVERSTRRNPLLLPELLSYILDFLDVSDTSTRPSTVAGIRVYIPSRESRKVLFALALTCHAISEPSLDRLWQALGSVVPLIRCSAGMTGVHNRIMPTGWTSIRRYAPRVRELYVANAQSAIFVISQYLKSTNSGPLLPNLKVLVWSHSGPASSPFFEGFLNPGLVSLDITSREYVDMPCPFFERIALLCPRLKALRWNPSFGRRFYESVLDGADTFFSTVLQLEKLECLELSHHIDDFVLKRVIPIGPRVFLSPQFKTLCMMLSRTLEVDPTLVTSSDTPFPNVETLGLEIWDLYFFTSLLRPYQQRFHHIKLEIHSPSSRPRVQSMLSCFTALATPQRIDSLQSITLLLHPYWFSEGGEDTDSSDSYCLTYETLFPLTSFYRLRKLYINLRNQLSISINDDELTALARSWPFLEVLKLLCQPEKQSFGSAKCPTLCGLLALIEACPKLTDVYLPIDARAVPADTNPNIRNTAIRCFGVSNALINEPCLVVDFLYKHLPSVDPVSTKSWGGWFWGGDPEYREECQRLWDEIERLL